MNRDDFLLANRLRETEEQLQRLITYLLEVFPHLFEPGELPVDLAIRILRNYKRDDDERRSLADHYRPDEQDRGAAVLRDNGSAKVGKFVE